MLKSILTVLLLTAVLTAQAQVPLLSPSAPTIDLRLINSGKQLRKAGNFMMGAALGVVVGIALPRLIADTNVKSIEEAESNLNAQKIAAYSGAGISLISLIGAGIHLIEAGNKLSDAYVPTLDGGAIAASPVVNIPEDRKMTFSEMQSAWGTKEALRIRNQSCWIGMTNQQALQSRGKPLSIARMEGNKEVWEYGSGKMYKRLTFVDGKLTEKE